MSLRDFPLLFAVALAAVAPASFAAHPLQTEDTGTEGAGNVEIENGFARNRFDATTVMTYQPQVSVGLSPTFDAIVQPSLVRLQSRTQASATGAGDTNVDAKWRFHGVDPWSLAIRAGVELPTGARGLGLPHGTVAEHGLLVATWDAAPSTVHANLGFTHAPSAGGMRENIAHGSAALMQALNERVILTVDAELDQDPDPKRRTWPGTALGGAIWTARPGLDLDIGYQVSLRAQTASRQWMAGVTYRFSL